ncbi:MAG: cadherin repeat domain-containing protein, partial [Gammaproteobacteria bacterium]|nr:cadherin repeat domain-containing protein [Gammaproteobacteria bacterium]
MKTITAAQNAKITNIKGDVNSDNAATSTLQTGDTINQGTELKLPPGSEITLELADGSQQVIIGGANDAADEENLDSFDGLLAATGDNDFQGDFSDDLPADLLAEIADIQALIESGDEDIDLPATAAGGGGENEGFGFVTMDRSGSETLAAAGYDTAGTATDADEIDELLGSTAAAASEVNNAPTIEFAANSFTEDSGVQAGAVAGTYTTADEENDPRTVTITPGSNANGHYELGDAGQVILTQAGVDAINAGDVLDEISLTVTQDDNSSLTDTATATPVITTENDAPTIELTTNSFTEDSGVQAGAVAGTYTTADEENDARTVTITPESNVNAHYELGDAGQVILTQAGVDAINAGEVLDEVSLTVTQDDNSALSGTTTATPSVTTVNDPAIISLTPTDATFTENSVAPDIKIATIAASDEDDALVLTLSDTTNYVIVGDEVLLTQAGADLVNRGEDLPDFTVDANGIASNIINPADTNHIISEISDVDAANNVISENISNGEAVGITATATDADAGDTVTYSLSQTDIDAGIFDVNAQSGVVTVKDASSINHETASEHTITVIATSSDGSSNDTQFTIAVTDHDVSAVLDADNDSSNNSVSE